MATRYAHTNLIAHDWEKLATFYARVFDCEPLEPTRDQRRNWLETGTGVKDARIRGQRLRLPGYGAGGPTLEVFQYDEVVPQALPVANRAGLAHIAFRVDSVEEVLRAIVDAGGSAHGDIVRRSVGGVGEVAFTYARDPEGNLIELQSWAQPSPQAA